MNEDALINAMTQKGHSVETAKGAIAGRGIGDLWNEYMGGSSGSSGGGSAPELNFTPTPSPLDSISQAFGDLNNQYSNYLASQPSLATQLQNYNQQFGVPQLQGALTSGLEQYDALGNQIRGVKGSVQQGSQNSIMTQGMLDRVTQARQAPMLEQQGIMGQNLSRLSDSLGTAQSNVSQMMSVAQADQARQDQAWLQKYSTAEIIASAAMTGWSTTMSAELEVLLTKYNAGVTMSEAEKSRMHELAMKENEQAFTLEQNNQKIKDLMLVGEGSSVYDPTTGQVMYKAPKTYAPSESGGWG